MSDQDLGFSVHWNRALKSLFKEFAPAAITSLLGEPVHIESLSVSDLSLPACARFCQQYLKMKPGDMAIVNDPSSGGSSLDEICLVRAISLGGKSETDFLLSIRFSMGGTGDPKSAIHSLRIPPTPIAVRDHLNKEILMAVGSHPGASIHFEEELSKHIDKLRTLELRLLRLRQLPGLSFSNDQLESYFDSTKKSLLSWISKNLSNGEFQFQHRLSTGELIKLRIECKENENILFDFIGTTSSENFQLTEYMSFAACFAALVSFSNFEIPANQGSFSALQLRTPQNSMLNVKQIKNTFLATRMNLKELCDFLRMSLLKLTPSGKNFARDSEGIGPCSLSFGPKAIWDFHLHGGQGGSHEHDGAPLFSSWTHDVFANSFSVEEIEKRFALQFENISKHSHILGKGIYKGGAGIQMNFRILAEAELDLHSGPFNERAVGQSGGKSGEKSEASFEVGREKTEISANLKQKLQPQTLLRFSSGGGGGWGEEKVEEDED